MEPAKIDWKRLDSVFILDNVYENIHAPQWFDFLSSDHDSRDDDAWFCRPDCNHPKTAEDFLKSTPTSKLFRSVSVSKLIGLGDWNRRELNLKRRGISKVDEDSENQNPNLSTPTNNQIKATIKSSAEKIVEEDDDNTEILMRNDEKPRLRSTQSARDLFGGRDIFNKITDFCNELKKLATRAKEEEGVVERLNVKKITTELKEESSNDGFMECHLKNKVDEIEKERKPLMEVSKERYQAGGRSSPVLKSKSLKKKLSRREDGAENVPISLDLEKVKGKDEQRLLQIRTSPPTPQCFSATPDPPKSTPPKAPKSRLKENERIGQSKLQREELDSKNEAVVGGREARTLDVFWFLKPCTL